MANKIQQRRGNFADLPTLSNGEMGQAEDVGKVYIGNNGTNDEFQMAPGTADFTVYMATTALGGLDKATQGATGLQLVNGTATGTAASKLVDSGASFTSALVNKTIYNATDDTWAKVTAVDSATQLSLSADIFVSGEAYEIASAIDNLPEAFATADSGFKANITVRISPGTFPDTIELIGKTAGDARTLTIQGSTTGTTTIAGEVTIRQKIFLKNLTFTKRVFLYFGADVDWTTCVTSGDDGFIVTKSTSIANTFRSSSVVVFENDPGGFTNISSTVTTGYTIYVATAALGGSDATNDGLKITQGTATSTTANKLIDSTANFNSADHLNKTVYNSTDDTWAKITAIDSTTQVSLSVDIMASGESYVIAAAKSTWQNAWDGIPGNYNADTTIRGSDDIYREDIDVFGKTPSGVYSITFVGTRVNTDTGTASSGANPVGNGSAGYGTLTDSSKAWTASTHKDNFIEITGGTGSGQIRVVHDNTATVLTITGRWDTVPDATSTYRIYTCNTRITGADSGAETTPVRDYCFKVDNGQKGVNLHHLKIDYAGNNNYKGGVLIFNGASCDLMGVRLQGHNYWGIQCNAAAAGSALACVFKDNVIGDLRVDQAATFTAVKRCRLVDATNRSIDASVSGSVFDVYETYIANVTGWGVGISAALNGSVFSDQYLEVDNCASHGVLCDNLGIFFANAIYGGARTTQVIKNNGGWGVLSQGGGKGAWVTGLTYSGNVSGTYSPTSDLVGGNA